MIRDKAELSSLSARTKLMPLRYKKILVAINNSLDLIQEAIRLIDTDKDKIRLIALKFFPPYEGELHLTGINDIREVIDAGKNKFIEDVNTLAIKKKSFHKTLSGKWRD